MGYLDATSAENLRLLQAVVTETLDITLETLGEILEHGGTSRKNDVLVETTTSIDG